MNRREKRVKYFRKQKILGGILVALGVLSAIITGGDITAAMLICPLGLWVMFTKEAVIYDDYYYELEAKKFDEWMEP